MHPSVTRLEKIEGKESVVEKKDVQKEDVDTPAIEAPKPQKKKKKHFELG